MTSIQSALTAVMRGAGGLGDNDVMLVPESLSWPDGEGPAGESPGTHQQVRCDDVGFCLPLNQLDQEPIRITDQ